MKRNLASASLSLFALSILLWLLLTLFESALVGISLTAERGITFILLVLPAATGAVLGLVSLRRRDGQVWLAAAGIALNGFFAIFHVVILAFAG